MKKILVIDDQKDNLTSLKAVITNYIPESIVLVSLTGKEGIKTAEKEQPDTIILDIIMPGMDGYQTCRKLKESDLTKNIPVLMLTAIKTDTESRVKGLDIGADAFLSKPVDPAELSAQVNVLLRIKAAEDELRAEKKNIEKLVEEKTIELKESEEKYKALYYNAPLSYQSLDENGNFIDVNPAWLKTLGYERSDIIGKWFGDLLHPEWRNHFEENFPEFKRRGSISDVQFRIRHKDRHYLDISFEGCVGYYPDGSFKQSYCVFQDITKRKLVEEKMITALEKAEESDRLKSAFLANMSHEIRTPMNGILGFANLLKEAQYTEEEQEQFIGIIENSGERMLSTINNLMDISKIESGQMDISVSNININYQLTSLIDFFKPEIEQKGMQLSFSPALSTKEANISTDKEKLDAILSNLIKNAVKYTNEGNIDIAYELKGSFIKFIIKDTGIGIAAEQQENIFKRFVQAEISLSKNFEGTGLGLSISKAYVEMLGGEIEVQSKIGEGSEFSFTIPYEKQSNLNTDNKLSETKVVKENVLRGLTILIAEDDKTADMFLTRLFQSKCKEVLHAQTGKQAVEMCNQNKDIGLILMDIKMPEMDGYEATREIRKFNKEIIIIAQTAYAIYGDREKSIEAGCNEYISKPIKSDELISKITSQFQ